MQLLFWKFVCWVDEHINHPLADFINGDDRDIKFVSSLSWKFCQWSQIGLWTFEEKIKIEKWKKEQ